MCACVSAHTDRTWARYRKPVNRTPRVCPGKRQTPSQGETAVASAPRRKWAGPDKPGPAARGGGDSPPPTPSSAPPPPAYHSASVSLKSPSSLGPTSLWGQGTRASTGERREKGVGGGWGVSVEGCQSG